MYESHGSSVVTAVIAEGMEEKFRITYTLKCKMMNIAILIIK